MSSGRFLRHELRATTTVRRNPSKRGAAAARWGETGGGQLVGNNRWRKTWWNISYFNYCCWFELVTLGEQVSLVH
jgi:hypothetical protein